ncbi:MULTISPECIES: type VI secretion system tube protein Hcp [Legionella]|uniref:Hemolysin-coregulated protein (Uncharacterized) n=1 Tax=Legionella cherrii TaxID=28084 RepID=A0A0W0SC46_9GAMM|nr:MULTISPECIES: type VI secretion system tube protein Hcp [Legionella]KTC80621.1 hypothetical protein Lche_2641 [Legionella cherrii]MCW8397333.1 type VI secretion system tube protein Hcp [Legionella sp. PATHC038]VEB34677.1 Hemolysin-coregulated protein (uncharacterized) [Legionella cherrii]
MASNESEGNDIAILPMLPDSEIARTQYKLMAKITTQASGVVKGSSTVKGYEGWVTLLDFKQRITRAFDAQNQLIGVPDCKYFRLTGLWDQAGVVPHTQSIFTGEDINSAIIHCLRSSASGEVEAAVEITLEKAKVLEVDYAYSHPAGPLFIVDMRPTVYKVMDKKNNQEFGWDLTKLMRVG